MKLQLSYPLNEVIYTQMFGNPDKMYLDMGMKGHSGVDFLAYHGEPVYATHDGFATYQIDSAGGHGVVVITDKELDDVNGNPSLWKTIYWHLVDGLKEPKFKSPFMDKTGFTPVKNGELIGYADNTGLSSGDHVHFALKKVAKGEAWGTFFNLDQQNGYFGAENPVPYFDGHLPFSIQIMEKEVGILKQIVNLIKDYLK